MNTETPIAPDAAAEKRAKKAAAERARRAAKKEREANLRNVVAKGTPQSAPGLAIEPKKDEGGMIPAPHLVEGKWQSIDVDGKTVKVDASLSPADAEKAARKLVAKPAPDVERVAPQDAAKRARKSAAKLPAGHVKFALSTSAYGVLIAADLDERIVKALKASDKVRSATKAANLPYHFPVMSAEDALACSATLASAAKRMEKDGASKIAVTSVKRYAAALAVIAKA